MAWKDSGAAQSARGLSAGNRRILDMAVRQAEKSAQAGKEDALDHGRWLNIRPDRIDFRDRVYQPGLLSLASRLAPPAELARTPVRDQGYLGSCTGMALATTIDILQRRQDARDPTNDERIDPPPVSARMLYEMGRAFDEHSDDDLGGSSLRGVIQGFFHNGVCREIAELDSPSDVLPLEWRFTIDRAKDASKVRLGAYARLEHVLLDYHSALNEVSAIVVSTFIHAGWNLGGTLLSEDDTRCGRISWDGTQQPLGGHAVVIVGYDERGFLVRNSWGEGWSCWLGQHAGVAHWSYDDWQNHVMDAWVIRLGVPGDHDARALGGRFRASGVTRSGSRGSPPRILVNGHYLHMRDGRLATRPPYNCELASIEKTADLLSETQDYDHLLIAVDSGLDALDTMVERALVLIPYLKKARIYPIFVWWRDGCFEQASEMLEDRARRLEPKIGGLAELGAVMLEGFAREFMQPFWRTFEGEVERAFTGADKTRGQGWAALRLLLSATRERERPLSVHAVAHSAGALWFGDLCRRLAEDPPISGADGKTAWDGLFRTVNLLAPICAPKLYTNPGVAHLWAGNDEAALGIYTLNAQQELEDRVGAFQGSFLSLAQRVFPIDGRTPEGKKTKNRILGSEQVARTVGQRRDAKWFPVSGGAVKSPCRSHRGLSSDPTVLRHVLDRINPGAVTELPPLPAA